MRQIQKANKLPRKKLLLLITAVVATALVVTGVMAYMKIGPFSQSVDPSADAASTSTKNNNSGGNKKPTPDDPDTGVPEKTPEQNEPTNGTDPDKKLIASITAANQNAAILQIRTLIETVSSDGTCDLSLTRGSQTVARSVAIQALANTSTCQGFDIPVSELSPGQWLLKITISTDGKQTQLTKTIDIT